MGGKNKAAIHVDDDIQSPLMMAFGNLSAQFRHPCGNALGGKPCSFSRSKVGLSAGTRQNVSSAITIPFWVLSFAANSEAAAKPRAHARVPPLVKTGQPSRSHRLMPLSVKHRFR